MAKVLVVALILAGVGVGAYYGARQVYFLGIDEGGRAALYRGLPYDLPFDATLYSEVYSAPFQADSLPDDRRDSVVDHELRSRSDAVSLLEDLEAAAIGATPTTPTSPPQPNQGSSQDQGSGVDGDNQGGQGAGGDSAGGGREGEPGRNSQGPSAGDGSRKQRDN